MHMTISEITPETQHETLNGNKKKQPSKTPPEREKEFDEKIRKTIEDEVVEDLNKNTRGGKLRTILYSYRKRQSSFRGKDFSLESKQSFKNHYENKIPEGHKKTKAEIWLKSSQRREFKGIVFDPTGAEEVNGYYNLWKGFNKSPIKGDCSLYWNHVKENICSNDPEAYRFVRKWLAYIFQKPD